MTTPSERIVKSLYNQLTTYGIANVDASEKENDHTENLENTLDRLVEKVSSLSLVTPLEKFSQVVEAMRSIPLSFSDDTISKRDFINKILEHMRCKRDENLKILFRLNRAKNKIEKSCVTKQPILLLQIKKIFKLYLNATDEHSMSCCILKLSDLEKRCKKHFTGTIFRLHDELLLHAFSFLSLKELTNLSFACKKIALLCQNTLLLHHIATRDFPSMCVCEP